MGLLSYFEDSAFIYKCVEQVRLINPDSAHLAREFCKTTKHHLLEIRDKGVDHEQAVNIVCLMILNNPDDFRQHEDGRYTRARALVIASNYCANWAEGWPDDAYSSVMLKAVSAFAEYMRTHRVKIA